MPTKLINCTPVIYKQQDVKELYGNFTAMMIALSSNPICLRENGEQHHHIHPPYTYTMATDHSTETTAKLLKAIHLETDTLWVLCVDGTCCDVCYWKETG